jgi:glycosyltransferase involved in cell wall biosynthesis
MRRTLRTASAVVQVSPEWAKADAALLGREVNTLRHAVPLTDVTPVRGSVDPGADLVLLYAGSLIRGQQSPSELVSAVSRLNQRPGRRIVLEVAGGDATLQAFEECMPPTGVDSWFRPLGWLGAGDLAAAMRRADCLVLIPSNERGRPVVPSKLYEYVAYERPVLVAGTDSGALSSLYEEWGHENVTLPTADAIETALERVRSGDYSMTLRRSACARAPMDETEFVKRYIRLATAAVLPRG